MLRDIGRAKPATYLVGKTEDIWPRTFSSAHVFIGCRKRPGQQISSNMNLWVDMKRGKHTKCFYYVVPLVYSSSSAFSLLYYIYNHLWPCVIIFSRLGISRRVWSQSCNRWAEQGKWFPSIPIHAWEFAPVLRQVAHSSLLSELHSPYPLSIRQSCAMEGLVHFT